MTEDELLFQLYGIKGYDTDAEKSPENNPGIFLQTIYE